MDIALQNNFVYHYWKIYIFKVTALDTGISVNTFYGDPGIFPLKIIFPYLIKIPTITGNFT